MALRAISLFAGGGGLDLGLERAGIARAVCRVEHEAYAAAVLAARSEDGSLAPAPVWSDVSTFDGRPWRGVVDLVFGGFPCQDISNAGLKEGIGGARSGLWYHYARIVAEVRPSTVFVENVPALVRSGLDVVLRDLASLGFDAEWGVLPACSIGAPHTRDRLFLLAHAHGRHEQARLGPRSRSVQDDGSRPLLHDWGSDPERAAGYFAARLGSGSGGARVVDGLAPRVDRVRLLGNGVVPGQAVAAWRELERRMKETE